ncbi:MAG: esterase [Dokdonia sp.]|jgi:predicted esterase
MKNKTSPGHIVSYQHLNTYETLNAFQTVGHEESEIVKNVWFVFHGMGYLSKYFKKYFERLDPTNNYIIVPQAPSKYYQDKTFKYVGASWLTKETTSLDLENVMRYIDAVWEAEKPKWKNKKIRLILMGYSQGVSIVTRWASSRKINCDHLLLHSGAIPQELTAKDFDFLSADTPVTYLYGNKDEYITAARKTEQQLKGNALFDERLKVEVFDGVHEVYTPFLKKLAAG